MNGNGHKPAGTKSPIEAAHIFLTTLETMCDEGEFAKGLPLPDEVPEEKRKEFILGIAFGLHLAGMLTKEMIGKEHFTITDMLLVVATLAEDDDEAANDPVG